MLKRIEKKFHTAFYIIRKINNFQVQIPQIKFFYLTISKECEQLIKFCKKCFEMQ